MVWKSISKLESIKYKCGYCNNLVASSDGYYSSHNYQRNIRICPECQKPSYFGKEEQVPGLIVGNPISNAPDDVTVLYDEARKCMSVNAYTSSVLSCRKLLMNIAVNKNADEGKRFIEYVEYLSNEGYIPPDGKIWVDHIRKKGNEATHEIEVMKKEDAEDLIAFSEMLLKFIYEFPARIPNPNPQTP